jgi:hypothetical protein
MDHVLDVPLTAAAQRAVNSFRDHPSINDLVFLEAWEMGLVPGVGAMLRARQIRRSNPSLAAEIRMELTGLRRFDQGLPATMGVSSAHAEHPIQS